MPTPLELAAESAFDAPLVESQETGDSLQISAEEGTQEQSATTPAATTPEATAEVSPKVEEAQEDSFSRVNPDELPEELKAVYKSLQADYTRKRQTESKHVKDLEAKLADLQSQITTGKVKNVVTQTNSELTAEEQLREIARQEIISQREESWKKETLQDVESIEPRLNANHPDYDAHFDVFVRAKLDEGLEAFTETNGTIVGFDYKSTLAEAKKEWDGYLNKRSKEFIEKQKALVKEKEATLKKQAPSTSKAESKPNAKMSLDEAAALAFE